MAFVLHFGVFFIQRQEYYVIVLWTFVLQDHNIDMFLRYCVTLWHFIKHIYSNKRISVLSLKYTLVFVISTDLPTVFSGIFHLPLLELSIIIFRDIKMVSQHYIAWLDCWGVQASQALHWWPELINVCSGRISFRKCVLH